GQVDPQCYVCKSTDCSSLMLLCDQCDRGWHTYCLKPPMADIPEGDWSCPKCAADEKPDAKVPLHNLNCRNEQKHKFLAPKNPTPWVRASTSKAFVWYVSLI
ncbi:hypothetical protein T484DRAFT_1640036, partial [Baffinella frigidus]